MADYTYIEEKGFRFWAHASQAADGTWQASVAFELIANPDPTAVPSIRYILSQPFEDENAALGAALAEGYRRAQTGDIVL
ncbi:hypothetical protein PO002_37635 [Cupriavidus necator]|uniref:hypothetical protein n=1 Tax=Cupriavidus necator TaxID=106590 RepID=UPI0039C0D92D